jgi:streptogramin lyase
MDSKNLTDKLKALFVAIATICMSFLFFVSCVEEEKSGKGVEYDPSKPVVLDSFHPDSGGIASKVIFDGTNFGSDPAKIKVYFNKKQAPVVGSTGSRMYAVVPRLPGDTCTVSVVVGNDSVIYDQKFRYKASATVSTIVGNGTTALKLGNLSEATLQTFQICVDEESNIFAFTTTNSGTVLRISETDNSVIQLATNAQTGWMAAPSATKGSGIITFPSDNIREVFWTLDPNEGWALRQHYMKFKEGTDVPPNPWKKNMPHCDYDGYYYLHFYNGHIVKMHPKTYEAETIFTVPAQGECYGMAFHPLQPKMLYMASYSGAGSIAHSISCFDVTDPAGTFRTLNSPGGGYRDGEVSLAQFRNPCQIQFDADGNLYVADMDNHCIRRITPANMVETVVGIPGLAGWKDGGKDEALFNKPRGISVTPDGTIYVSDNGNARIRKLAIE